MTKIEIEQFLVDHHPQGDTIEVDCIWPQRQLLKKLQEKVDIYKEILEAYRNRKVLNGYI